MASELIAFRQARKSTDIPFLMSSWLQSFRENSEHRYVEPKLYFSAQQQLVGKLLARSVNLIAVNADEPNQILGWICAERLAGNVLCVHFVYVKGAYRRHGLAKALVQKFLDADKPDVVMYTHLTKKAKQIKKSRPDHPVKEWVYNPYLLYSSFDGWSSRNQ